MCARVPGDGAQGYMLGYLSVSSNLLIVTFYFEIKVALCCPNHAGLELVILFPQCAYTLTHDVIGWSCTTSAGVHMLYNPAWRPWENARCLLCHCLPHALETGSLTEPGVRLVRNEPQLKLLALKQEKWTSC